MSEKIFISYRREDSAATALSICQYLEHEFGRKNVFIDVDMRAGAKFPVVLEQRLAECKVMLVLIGPNWLDAQDEQGKRRLENPDDWVRLEISQALKRDVTVIPVCVNRAELPRKANLPEEIRGLLDHQAATVTTTGFRNEMLGLVRDIRSIRLPRFRGRNRAISVGLLLLLLFGVGFYWNELPHWVQRAWSLVGDFGHQPIASNGTPNKPGPISDLNRSWSKGWTLYQLSNSRFAQFIKLDFIREFGGKAAALTRYVVDPSGFSIPGKDFSEEDYGQDELVVDCRGSNFALSEKSVFSKTGELKYHYKWADPEFLDLSIGGKISPNSVVASAQNIMCHVEMHSPLVKKEELSAMTFKSFASTAGGDGEMFYKAIEANANSGRDNERIVIVKENEDHSVAKDVFPGLTTVGLPPAYRIIVERAQFDCDQPKVSFLKAEYYDASINLVYLFVPNPPTQFDIVPTAPLALLRRIVCAKSEVRQ